MIILNVRRTEMAVLGGFFAKMAEFLDGYIWRTAHCTKLGLLSLEAQDPIYYCELSLISL